MPRERDRREPQPGGPPLGPLVQQRQARLRQDDPGRLQQITRLLRREAQVGRPQLDQLAGDTQPMQAKPRIAASREHDAQLRRQPRQQELQLRERIGRAQLVQIIDHQHARSLKRSEVGQQAPNHRLAVEVRRRAELLHEPVAPNGTAQLAEHR